MSEAQSARAPERAIGIRIVFAVVFLGIAAVGVASSWGEVEHLVFALGHSFHSGEPPRAVAVFGVALVFVAGLWVLTTLLRGREVPLWLSAGVLLGAALCLLGSAGGVPQGRSWAAADTAILKVGSKVQREMVDVLQTQGKVPTTAPQWEAELADAAKGPSPARTRSFKQVPYSLRLLALDAKVPEDLRPGEVIVQVAPVGEAFEIRLVGFDKQGEVALLHDDRGREVVLTGAFNPEMRNGPPAGLRGLPGLPPLPRVP